MSIKRLTQKKLGELLLENGVISRTQLEQALQLSDARKKNCLIGEIFVELGMATEEDVIQALIRQYKMPHISLANCHIEDEVLELIPEAVANKYNLVPIDKVANNLTVVMANPLDEAAIKEIKELSGCEVTSFIATPTAIQGAIDKYYRKIDQGEFPSGMGYK